MQRRVFVVNEPTRRDPATGEFGRLLDLSPAEEYGDLVHLLPNGRVSLNPVDVVQRLEAGLVDFSAEDYLLPIGDMTACAIAASIVAVKTDGRFSVLRWNGRVGRYAVVRVELSAE